MARIIERFQEGSRWVVRIANDAETRSLFLYFQTDPTDAEVRAAFRDALDAEQAAKDQADAEQTADTTDRKTIQSAVRLYETGQLTNAQIRNLLDKFIARARRKGDF